MFNPLHREAHPVIITEPLTEVQVMDSRIGWCAEPTLLFDRMAGDETTRQERDTQLSTKYTEAFSRLQGQGGQLGVALGHHSLVATASSAGELVVVANNGLRRRTTVYSFMPDAADLNKIDVNTINPFAPEPQQFELRPVQDLIALQVADVLLDLIKQDL